jgi:dienelactone hydrolase
MAAARTIEFDPGGKGARGALALPEEAAARAPAVLICGTLGVEPPEARELPGLLQAALLDAGIAVAAGGPAAVPTGPEHAIDAAALLLEWMAERPEIDPARLGVLGYSSGAIVAACLAGRSPRIAGLCLISPMTPASVVEHRVRDGAERGAAEAAMGRVLPFEGAAANHALTLLIHGAADREQPASSSFEYLRHLENTGRRAAHILIARGDHAFLSPAARGACLEQVVDFFAGGSARPVAA